MMKTLVLALAAFFQVVFSQQQQQQQQQQQPLNFGMTAAQMWDPNTWAIPYYAAASQAWTNYLKNAQEASNQLYKQWDVTGAGNLYNTGMGLAQQAASQAQQGAQTAMDTAQQGAQAAVSQGTQAAQVATSQAQQGAQLAQKGAQTAAAQAQQLLS